MRNEPEIGHHGGCGGRIRVKDWHDGASRGWRYEAWCEKCRACDPNGYGSIKETVEGASEYFRTTTKSTLVPA